MQNRTDSASSGPAPSAPQNQQDDAKRATGPLGGIILLAGLLWLTYLIIQNFVIPLVWAGILVYVSWPLHQRLSRRLGRRDNLSALLTTALLSTAIVIPVLGLSAMLGDELGAAYRHLQGRLAAGPVTLPPAITELPWLGERLQRLVERLASDPTWVRGWLGDQAPNWLQEARQVMATIGRNLFKLGITLLALFFLYRDGENLLRQIRLIAQRFLGSRVEGYWSAVTVTTQGVVYGLVLTALAQGALAGLGYWVAGVETAVLWGTLTALLALIPFGAPLVWGSIGLWLLASGEIVSGTGLLLWGALVVSFVDNILRPLAISSTARIPFFLVLLGVLGGLGAFGLVGLFVGPIILSVLLAVWREWLDEQSQGPRPAPEGPARTDQ